MRIHCSICETPFDAGPRVATCPECGEAFAAGATEKARPPAGREINIDVTSERVAADFDDPLDRRTRRVAETAHASSRRLMPRRALVAAFGVALCMAGVARRDLVVRALPASAGAFAAVGLPVNLRGLEFRHVQSRIIEDGEARVLAVEGEVANPRPVAGKTPDMLISVRAGDGRVVYSWTAPAPKKDIASGETVYFRARLASPPPEGKDIMVQFAALDPKPAAPSRK